MALVGGAKVEGKYPAVLELAKMCDSVLVGGLLAYDIESRGLEVPQNVVLGKLSDNRLDLAMVSIAAFAEILKKAKQVIWGGPMGKYEVEEGNHANNILGQAILLSNAEVIIGGGDTVAALDKLGLLAEFNKLPEGQSFISTGGGAMLKFFSDGTLPTIQSLD